MKDAAGRIEVRSCRLEPGTLITARSFLIDRAVPDCEIIALPGREVPGGEIPFVRGSGLPAVHRRGWRRLLKGAGPREPVPLEGGIGVDCRLASTENWSHFLNQHAPIAFELARQLDVRPEDLTLVLPPRTPDFILAAARHLGFRAQPTAAPVIGESVAFTLGLNITVPDRRNWVMASGILDRLAHDKAPHLPKHVFLARRKERYISNQPEIEALLQPRGYVTVYPEDLSVPEQLQLFNTAETMVAVSGAGLGPLLYRHPRSPLRRLVEIMPAGLVTDFFRVMAQQVGCEWIGVRGRLKPEYIKPAYKLEGIFKKYVMDDFEVDPVSLTRALDWHQG